MRGWEKGNSFYRIIEELKKARNIALAEVRVNYTGWQEGSLGRSATRKRVRWFSIEWMNSEKKKKKKNRKNRKDYWENESGWGKIFLEIFYALNENGEGLAKQYLSWKKKKLGESNLDLMIKLKEMKIAPLR